MSNANQSIDDLLEIVRTNIRIAIALRNTKAKTVSLEAGMSQNSLGSFIRGETSMSFVNVLKVCEVLDIPIGLLAIEGAISPARLRLHQALEGAPPELVLEALSQMRNEI
ncbi:MAG: helix-turn-helix transcriptional regulator [Sulfitobacter sp.]|jgi:DNA-binding Xre family transcriptional regulator